ncbi:RNA 3'-phosphate cyclase [archaeon]|jgi:RNA 3'-terminal phosphate cyclase (GTP)|nr:RNA 3'-phosphate cyclase [archaeon]|tara:strand:- start:9291 stop:10382 length:1092 start_codon:yes stop_codon:yes gene_type:complete
MIELDGSYKEGGGQILRTALALSTLMNEPFEISDIRKNRPQPGLKNQHLFCVRALEKLCSAKIENAFLGSDNLRYFPGKIKGKRIDIDIQTAGSISLFLQAVLLPSMFADKAVRFNITGGTDVKWAAPINFFMEAFLPQIKKYVDIECRLVKRGYYPKGNGKVELKISPKFKIFSYDNFDEFCNDVKENTERIDLTGQGHLIQIKGISHASSSLQNAEVAERQAKAAEMALKEFNCPVNIQAEYNEALSTGSGITLWAIFSKNENEIDFNNPIRVAGDALGEKGKKAEDVGTEAAKNLVKKIESRAAVDKHLADQLIPFIGLFGGKIKVSEISNHTRTNIYATEKFLGNSFMIDEKRKVISKE